jgi:hypothetical protein
MRGYGFFFCMEHIGFGIDANLGSLSGTRVQRGCWEVPAGMAELAAMWSLKPRDRRVPDRRRCLRSRYAFLIGGEIPVKAA